MTALTDAQTTILDAIATDKAIQADRSDFLFLKRNGYLIQSRINPAVSQLSLTDAGRAALKAIDAEEK